ncbi:MAG: hypothetical protein MUF30_12020 [Burkholderiales bacterium]|jgi:hypothetical protein|nr:hypothetical protein [Burkholderiales bacterium]
MSTSSAPLPPTDAPLARCSGWTEEVEWAEFNLPAELRATARDALPLDPRDRSHD